MMDMLPDGWALIDPGEARSGSPPSPTYQRLLASNAPVSPYRVRTIGTTPSCSPVPMSPMI